MKVDKLFIVTLVPGSMMNSDGLIFLADVDLEIIARGTSGFSG